MAPVKQLAEALRAKGDPAPLLNQALPRAEMPRLLRDRARVTGDQVKKPESWCGPLL